jgi:hypothetical protein
LKTAQQLSLKTDIAELTIGPVSHVEFLLKPLEQIIKGVTRAQMIIYGNPSTSELILNAEGLYSAQINTDLEHSA